MIEIYVDILETEPIYKDLQDILLEAVQKVKKKKERMKTIATNKSNTEQRVFSIYGSKVRKCHLSIFFCLCSIYLPFGILQFGDKARS